MSRYRILPTARRQLKTIHRFTVSKWGVARADAYIEGIDKASREIAQNLDLARPRTEHHPLLRARRFRSHVLYVVSLSGGLVLVAILHRSMEPRRRLARALRELPEA